MVRKGMLATGKVPGCERIKVPAQVIFYNPKEGYVGSDHVIYEVTEFERPGDHLRHDHHGEGRTTRSAQQQTGNCAQGQGNEDMRGGAPAPAAAHRPTPKRGLNYFWT